MLTPISGSHSISRVIASFFLAQSFVKPKFIFDKLIANNKLKDYQKKGLTSAKTINFQNNALNISDDSNNGFIFEEFNQYGKSVNVLKCENTNNRKGTITIENRKYSNWANFKTKFTNDVNDLAETFDIYIEAIGLTYVDEFIWNSDMRIDVNSIFNEEADLINKKFLTSYNGTIISVSQSGHGNDLNFCEEKTEIFFNNQTKRIVINHTYALKLKEISVYSEETRKGFLDYFERAHQANKDILQDILNPDIKALINLK